MTFAQRRLRNVALAGLAAITLVGVDRFYDMSLRDAAFLNGWMLLAAMVFLSLFNIRKKIHVLPLIPLSAWLQAHIYMGCLAALLFGLHTDFELPNGLLETVLWLLFIGMVGSGVVGLLLSRLLPRRISSGGERAIFERIPTLRAQLRHRVADLAMLSVRETRSSVISDFYAEELAGYLQHPRNFLRHLIGSTRPQRRMRARIDELRRFLDDRGQQILDEIDELVAAKANLDQQFALQFVLKAWLFIHIPLNYALMIFTITHVGTVYAFAAGAP